MRKGKTTKKKTAKTILLAIIITVFGLSAPALYGQSTISGPLSINNCDEGIYTITVTNTTPGAIGSIVITNTLPNGNFSYVPNSAVLCFPSPGCATCNLPGGSAEPTPSGNDLTWDIDTLCSGTLQLAQGEEFTVQFTLSTNCDTISGNNAVRVDYVDIPSGTPLFDTDSTSIEVMPGAVIITKTPFVQPAGLNDNVTWTLTVQNTGLGTIENVVVTDVLGAGLLYVSDTGSGINSGQTTTWTSAEFPALASMPAYPDPGYSVTFDITAQVISCHELENIADVRWGCGGSSVCFDTEVDGGTATASVEFEPTNPFLVLTPPDISLNYCVTASTEVLSLFNDNTEATGPARNTIVKLQGLDPAVVSITNIQNGVTFNTGVTPPQFENIPDIAPGDTFDLTFDVGLDDNCNHVSGQIIYIPEYRDECDNPFYPTPVLGSYDLGAAGAASLSVAKTNVGSATHYIGETATFEITVDYSGPTSCGSSTTGLVTVTDTIPAGFTIADGGTGNTSVPGVITWTFDPAAAPNFSDTIILQLPDRTQCETYCNTTNTNTVTAVATDCCGCVLSGTATADIVIECDQLNILTSDKSAALAPGSLLPGPCETLRITSVYNFEDIAALDDVDLEELTVTENNNNRLTYAGLVSADIGGTNLSGCIAAADNTPAGTLAFTFPTCGYGSVRNRTLTIVYDLLIDTNTGLPTQCQPDPPCGSSYSWEDWTDLDLGPDAPGGQCLSLPGVHETVNLTVTPPAMSVTITPSPLGAPGFVENCAAYDIAVTAAQTSDVNPYDVHLVLENTNYYTIQILDCNTGDVQPTVCDAGGSYSDTKEWTFNDLFTANGTTGIIRLRVQKRCSNSPDLAARLYYDDICHDDDVFDNNNCETAATASSLLLLTGDIFIEKTPEVVFTDVNQVEWTIYVTNAGDGTATNVTVEDTLQAAHSYVSSTVAPDPGDVTTTPGSPANGVTWTITSMDPGEVRTITLLSDFVDCEPLGNSVSARWGCDYDGDNTIDEQCEMEGPVVSTVELPTPNLVSTSFTVTPISMCDPKQAEITLRNAGQTNVYELVVSQTLPEGLSYGGSPEYEYNDSGSWIAAPAPTITNPTPTTTRLTWRFDDGAGGLYDYLQELPREPVPPVLKIRFDIDSACDFESGSLEVETEYKNPCGDTVTPNSVGNYTLDVRYPDIEITKTRTSPPPGDPIACGQQVVWEIEVENTGTFDSPVVWVEDTMDAGYTFVSSAGGNDGGANGYGGNPLVTTWEILDLDVGDSTTLTLTVDSLTSLSADCEDVDNVVEAFSGCGTADGSSATKPGTDEVLCVSDTVMQETDTATREPTLGYLDIGMSPEDIDACDDSTLVTIVLENTGPTDAPTVDLAITLPPGITYNSGTTEIGLGIDTGTATTAAIAGGFVGDPAPSGSTITFYDFGDKGNNLAAVIQADGGNDTLVLRFTVQSACYVTDNMSFDLRYYDCCDDTQHTSTTTQTLTALFPSLTVVKTADLSQVDCGSSVEYTITVTNGGSGNAEVVRVVDTLGDWLDYVPGSFTEDQPGTITFWEIGSDPQVVGWEFNDLGAGATAVFTFEATLNPDGSDCADAGLRQNNVSAQWACGTAGDATDDNPNTTIGYACTNTGDAATDGPLTQAMPDLHITGITALIGCTGGVDGTFTGSVEVTVENQGDGDTLSGFTISVTDGTWTGTGTTGVLASGTSRTVTIDTAGWSPDCNGCAAYTLDATVDSVPDVCECDETNNTYSDTYTAPIADLVVNSITPTCTGDGLSQVVVNIGNTGCADAPASFTLHLADDQGNSDDITVNTLNAGTNTDVTFTDWPTACSPAAINFTATADYNDEICECDGVHSLGLLYNNPSPNLVVSTITPSVSCTADGTMSGTIEVQVTNSGNGAVGADFQILVNDGQGWSSELWYNTDLGGTLPLAASGSDTVTFNWTRAFTAEPYVCNFSTISVAVDSQDDICECTNAGNTNTDSYTLPYSNLRVNSVTPSCTGDGSYSIDVDVDNNGCGNAAGITVRLSDDDGETQSQTISLNAGASQTVTFSPWPADGDPASLAFTAEIDPAPSAICELSGADNSAGATYDRANLNLVSITPSCTTDNTFEVDVVIENNGSSVINTDFVVRLTDNDGNTPAQTFTAVGGTLPLNDGTQQTVTFTNWSTDGSPTTLNFNGVLDPTDLVCESNNGDNTDTGTITVYGLQAVSVTASEVCTADGTITGTMDVTVSNNGGNAINTDFQILVDDGQGWTSELFFQAGLGGTLPMAPGASQTVTFDWTRAFTAFPYTCNFTAITVTVDSQNAICEGTNADNQATDSHTLNLADLTIDTVASSITCISDGSLTGTTVTVSNNGCAAAAGVVVRLASDCGLTFADETVDLAAGETADVFFAFTAGINTCTCGFSAEIDPDDAICELDGTNNAGISTQTMIIPDVEVQGETLSIDCADDGVIEVSGSVTLVNNGCGPNLTENIPMRFTLYDSTGCGGNMVSRWTQLFRGVNLPSGGGTQRFTVQPFEIVTDFCSAAASGECRFSIFVEADYSDVLCEWDGTDNTHCANISAECLDLEATAVTAATNVTGDGVFNGTITVTVTNGGSSPITEDFSILVDDGNGWSSELRYNADLGGTLPLAAGASVEVTFTWDRDFTAEPFTCEFGPMTAQLDSQDEICQCRTDNDTVTTTYFLPLANLVPTAITPTCGSDGMYTVEVTVENNGCTGAAAGSFTVHLEDSLGHTADFQVDGLASGAAATVTFDDWPASCDPDTVTFTVRVDYNNTVYEITDTDNVLNYTYTNTSPDLTITDVTPSADCSSPGNIDGTMAVTVVNNGNSPVTEDFKVIVDDGQGWNTEKYFQADLNGTLPIGVGGTATVTVDWNRTFTGDTLTCDFNNIAVSLDVLTSVCECASGNNETVASYHLPYPDLNVQSITPICSADGERYVEMVIGNKGCEALTDDFTIDITDSTGESQRVTFRSLGGKLPLGVGETQKVTITQWTFDCGSSSTEYRIALDPENKVCDLGPTDNTFQWTHNPDEPDLSIGDIDWDCKGDGSIAFTITVSNNGLGSAANVPCSVYDESGSVVFSQAVDLAKGTSTQLSFTTGVYPKDQDIFFRFVVDEEQTVCECDGTNNEKSTIVNCPPEEVPEEGEPKLELATFCPPGQAPGGLFRFEIQLENTGDADAENVKIEDTLPEGFQYVSGSSSLDGMSVGDPGLGPPLLWEIGTLEKGREITLVFSAVADADIDPGRYVNQAKATSPRTGKANLSTIWMDCYTVVTREAGAGCCLKVEQWAMDGGPRPEGPLSFIEPYFHTESAMFTAYAIFNLWRDAQLETGSMPLFMRERLHNYARSTIEEFYFNSRLGLTLPDGTLWFAPAGAYPEQVTTENPGLHWARKQVDETVTVSQMGFELLALNEAINIETRDAVKEKLKRIIHRKMEFLGQFMDNPDDLPHGWEIKEKKKDEAEVKVKVDGKEDISNRIKRLDAGVSLYDKAVLYLSMVELGQSGYANAETFGGKLRKTLHHLDKQTFDSNNLREEFFFILSLLESGQADQAKAKIADFEKILATKDTKGGLKGLHDYALAAAVDKKAGGTLYADIMKRMKEKYYLKDTGIFADKQPDFTFKMNLKSLASLLLAFETADKAEQERSATVLYRTFDEVGLFLKKRNLMVGKPLYSILKNYPFSEPLLPVLSFTKAKESIAPVFSENAVVHSTRVKPVGEVLIPGSFSKILSPSYETRSSRIAAVSFGLQYFGRLLASHDEWVVKEEGRSLNEAGKAYMDSLMQGGAGIRLKGNVLLPYDELAVRGPKQGEHNLEPLNAGMVFSTATLADYMVAERFYVDGGGKHVPAVLDLMAAQTRIVEKFKEMDFIPAKFSIFIDESGEATVIPKAEKASKVTIAKLFHLLPKDKAHKFLGKALKGAAGELLPEDLVFLSAAPELVPYFKKEIKAVVDYKDSKISYNAADIIGRRLLGQRGVEASMENLLKNWDKEAVLPKSDKVENIEKGLIYHHEPGQFLLYLLASHESNGFRFKRTLNFFTYMLENEWGLEWNSFIKLPSSAYRVFREGPRERFEPGDLVNFRVRVDNTCPEGFGSAFSLPSLYLKSRFVPSLIYTGTQLVDGLDVLGDFRWRYRAFPEGSLLEYMYQAFVPYDFQGDFMDGWIYAGGRQGVEDFGPDTGSGDDCEDIRHIQRVNFVPLDEIRGVVFADGNVNGIKDLGELGIANIMIKDTRGRVFRSDAEGRFTVLAGDLHEGVQIELRSVPGSYVLYGPPTRLVNRNYTGEIYFALIPTKTVTGFVYVDANQNGTFDEGEVRPAGVLLRAKDKEVITGKDGEFIFRNLPVLWQQWIEVSEDQSFYKGGIDSLRFSL